MEQIYDGSLLPALPTGDGACSLAVCSVWRRGFYDVQHVTERYPLLTAQFGRLVEEVGEFAEAAASMKLSKITDELADVMIVLCQMAWLSGMEPDVLIRSVSPEIMPLCVLQSKLFRAIRKDNTGDVYNLLELMACQCKRIAKTHDIDLEQAMRDKITRDEQRGIRHEGGS